MFQTAELGQSVSHEEFDRVADGLRIELIELQAELRNADFPVIVVFAGLDGAGKGESVNLINEWMDPRFIATRAYQPPSEEERERPPHWRYWRDLPPKGTIGLFLSAWYSEPLGRRVEGHIGRGKFERALARIASFERTLTDDGALVIKFWLHLSRAAQKRRLQKLEADDYQKWRVTKEDWRHWKQYDRFIAAAEQMIRRTDTGPARWVIVEGEDARFRSLAVLMAVRDSLRDHLARRKALAEAKPKRKPPLPQKPARTVLDGLDQSLTLSDADYSEQLHQARAELGVLDRKLRAKGISTLLMFEGPDAAGKGGAIRRLAGGLDARDYRVIPFSAPTDEERAQHYLWRFWRNLPRAGSIALFDRSWYGRVLVERVEGFVTPEEWGRAYAEINDFEEQLAEAGIVLGKFWIHISKEEQLRRFHSREATDYKRWKLTEEDWRNRAKGEAYETAVNEMVERTSTATAPWTLVQGNDKNHARIKVIRTVIERWRERLG